MTASCRDCSGSPRRFGEASGGRTKLFIQLIDFLAIRRRPERTKFLQQYLRITDVHRRALGRFATSATRR